MPPVRFFCQHCSLMMKIGAQMAGHTVMCPQCGSRIAVPMQSDPQAEALYQFMKKKRASERPTPTATTEAPKKSPPPKPQKQKSAPPKPVPAPTVLPPPPGESFSELEPDEVDQWIDEFWATVPETDDHPFDRESVPHTLKRAPIESPQSTIDAAMAVTRYRQTVLLFRIWLLIVFVVGLVAGIYVHSVYADSRQRHRGAAARSDESSSGSVERIVQGALFYSSFDGRPVPDADAVVIFLPLDRVPPAVPMNIEGLRPNDELIDPNSDGAQQITEFGGYFRRTGADGKYSVELESGGRYLVLMISSHARRADASEPDAATLRELGRFFKEPRDLIGQYGFDREEYDFSEGKYLLRKTFR